MMLKLVGFLGIAETWEKIDGAAVIDFYFFGAFIFGAGFAEDGVGRESFVVNLCN